MSELCKDCKFFDYYKGNVIMDNERYGVCKFYPPKHASEVLTQNTTIKLPDNAPPHIVDMYEQRAERTAIAIRSTIIRNAMEKNGFPCVSENDWCGNFAPKQV